MTIKTEITDKYRYNECIAVAAKLRLIDNLIESTTEEEEMIYEEEYDQYVRPASRLIEQLAIIVSERAKTYIEVTE